MTGWAPVGDLNLVDLVTFTPVDPPGPGMRVHLVGDDELTGGTAQWEEVERPRRRSATEWTGTLPYRLKIPIMFDGVDVLSTGEDISMEAGCDALSDWCKPSRETGQPTVLLVDGPLKIPNYQPRWVIDDLEWVSGTTIRRADRQRIRQEVVVTLLEHTAAAVFLGPAAAARARAGL